MRKNKRKIYPHGWVTIFFYKNNQLVHKRQGKIKNLYRSVRKRFLGVPTAKYFDAYYLAEKLNEEQWTVDLDYPALCILKQPETKHGTVA